MVDITNLIKEGSTKKPPPPENKDSVGHKP